MKHVLLNKVKHNIVPWGIERTLINIIFTSILLKLFKFTLSSYINIFTLVPKILFIPSYEE